MSKLPVIRILVYPVKAPVDQPEIIQVVLFKVDGNRILFKGAFKLQYIFCRLAVGIISLVKGICIGIHHDGVLEGINFKIVAFTAVVTHDYPGHTAIAYSKLMPAACIRSKRRDGILITDKALHVVDAIQWRLFGKVAVLCPGLQVAIKSHGNGVNNQYIFYRG